MKRRTFIKNSFAGLPLILSAPSIVAASGKDPAVVQPNGKTVLVIGAGISGLAAAKKLKENGYTVVVLEAQNRVGGRICTNRSLGFAFDEGASWIHGPKGNPITNLAQRGGATTYLTDDDSTLVYDINGIRYTDRTIASTERAFNRAVAAVQDAGTPTQSFEAVFNRMYPSRSDDNLWKFLLSAYLEFDTGGDVSTLSSTYLYDDEAYSGDDVIITNGYDKVTDFLATGLDLRLNSSVTAINYTGEKVTVSANGKEIEADYVIVSVPLGVLKNKVIHFNPALPADKMAAIANTNMGNVNKFLLTWNTAFWDTNTQYIGYTPNEKGKFNYFLNLRKFTNVNALVTYALGNYAAVTERMSDREIINHIMRHLQSMYGNDIPEPVHMLRTRWGQNINAYGAYSYATNGTTTADFDTLATTVGNQVFFAGEHTSKAYRGTVHGAYLSGIREAEKIMQL